MTKKTPTSQQYAIATTQLISLAFVLYEFIHRDTIGFIVAYLLFIITFLPIIRQTLKNAVQMMYGTSNSDASLSFSGFLHWITITIFGLMLVFHFVPIPFMSDFFSRTIDLYLTGGIFLVYFIWLLIDQENMSVMVLLITSVGWLFYILFYKN